MDVHLPTADQWSFSEWTEPTTKHLIGMARKRSRGTQWNQVRTLKIRSNETNKVLATLYLPVGAKPDEFEDWCKLSDGENLRELTNNIDETTQLFKKVSGSETRASVSAPLSCKLSGSRRRLL